MIQLTEEAVNKIQVAVGIVLRLIKGAKPNEIAAAEADIIGQLAKVGVEAYWVKNKYGDMIRVDIRL